MSVKTAFVTGATAGIGRACVDRLVADGWQVVATGRRQERLDALAAAHGDAVHPLRLDAADCDACAGALDLLPERFRAIDLLVANAGLALGTAVAQQAEFGNWRTMIDTNITGLAAIVHALLPTLIERRGGVVLLSSVAATYPYRGGNVYGGTKAFVRQFALGLRSDLAGTGVRVTSVEPGMVETEFTLVRTGGDRAASDALYAGAEPMTAADIADTIGWIAALPPHLNINTIELMPTRQSFAGFAVERG